MPAPAPKYRRVIAYIREQIGHGTWPAGQRLPTVDALAEQFGVSRYTIGLAEQILKETGELIGRQGEGVFVADRSMNEAEPDGPHQGQ